VNNLSYFSVEFCIACVCYEDMKISMQNSDDQEQMEGISYVFCLSLERSSEAISALH